MIEKMRAQLRELTPFYWLLLVINLLLYISAFPLGLIFTAIWWFFASQRVSTKLKKIVGFGTGGVFALLIGTTVYAYSKDPEPTLELHTQSDQVVQSEAVDISGSFSPHHFDVEVNDTKIETQDGTFKYTYPLTVGENIIKVEVSNFKSVEQTLKITREAPLPDPVATPSASSESSPTVSPSPSALPTQAPTAPPVASPSPQVTTDTTLVTRIIDGDTFEIEGGKKVRLIGIDTPEVGECYYTEAKDRLSALILQKQVKMVKDVSETDRYGRLLRYVYLEDSLVNEMMVREGYAYASSYPPDIKNQSQLRNAQTTAKELSEGFWGACERSSPVPTSKPQTTTTPLAPVPVQSTAPATSAPAQVPVPQPVGACAIKGNISSSGEKIFHAPGQRDYDKTIIDESKGERFFCTEDEAKSAGWRKAKR
jgi:micrococcal nuclease